MENENESKLKELMLMDLKRSMGCDGCKHNLAEYEYPDCAGSCPDCTLACPCAGCINHEKWEYWRV